MKSVKNTVLMGIAVVVVLVALLLSVYVVPVGYTGILLTMGRVQDTPIDEGLVFKVPLIQNIVTMDNRVQLLEVSTEAFSKDIQTISAKLAVNYQLERAATFSIYKNIGRDFESLLIIPATHETLKSVCAQYTAEELISQRQKVSDQIKDGLYEKMTSYGISVIDFNILDFDFSDEYIKAVEDKQVAEQKRKQVAIENQISIDKAQATADSLIISSQSQADAKKIEADAEAYKLEKEKQQLSDAMLKKMWIEAWDGKLPVMMSQEDMTTIMDLNSLFGSVE